MKHLLTMLPTCLLCAVAVASGCTPGGAGEDDSLVDCVPQDDARARDIAGRDRLRLCPPGARRPAAGTPPPPDDDTCPALAVKAWRATIRYSGELGGTDGPRRVEHQVVVDIHADMPVKAGPNGVSAESWAPGGKATVHTREFEDGRMVMESSAEGAPDRGDSKLITGSRILLSINRRDCSYTFYSNGSVVGPVTWFPRIGPPRHEAGSTGYGAIRVANQPANLALSGRTMLPLVKGDDITDNAIETPEHWIAGIETRAGLGVEWAFVPVDDR